MMHIYLTFPLSENYVPGAMVAVPERQCLTFAKELAAHLRPGVEMKLYDIGPDGGSRYEWRFKCT